MLCWFLFDVTSDFYYSDKASVNFSARIVNSSNLLNVLAKGSISDVWLGVELALIQKQFLRGLLFFQNLNHRQGTLINFKTTFLGIPDDCFYLPFFLFVLLLLRICVCVVIKREGLKPIKIFVCLNFFWSILLLQWDYRPSSQSLLPQNIENTSFLCLLMLYKSP